MKRLLKRPAYIAVLAAVPIAALALSWASSAGSGIVTAGLVAKGSAGGAEERAARRLTEAGSAMRILTFDGEEEASAALRSGEIEAVWILGDLEGTLRAAARSGTAEHPIKVVEREDDPLLALSREKLYAAIFPELSYEIYADLMEDRFGETDGSVLRSYYDTRIVTSRIIEFESVSGGEDTGPGYMLSPLRGLLSLIVLAAALSSALYSIGEVRRGAFVWAGRPAMYAIPLLSHFLAALGAGAASLTALAAGGVLGNVLAEIACMTVFCALCAVFCEALRLVLGTEERFAAAIPAAIILSLALAPIFVDIRGFAPVKALLPPYWYLIWTRFI